MRSASWIKMAVASIAFVASIASCSSGGSHLAPAPSTTVLPTTASVRNPPPARAAAAPGCGNGRPHAPGQTMETFAVGGVDRSYALSVPDSYRGDRPVPVVFEFHGFGSNGMQQLLYGNFGPEAQKDGFIVVAPDGQGSGGGRHFNLQGAAGEADDVAFTLALLDRLEATLCLDAKRVYATGMSDGGGMTSVLACRAADRFAAFGSVALVFHLPGCAPGRPVPIMAFHGTADPIVPFAGGPVHCCGGASVPDVPGTMVAWAAQDRCSATPDEAMLSAMVLRRSWSGCAGASAVVLYAIQGGGHTWPGTAFSFGALGVTTHEIDASQTLWDFFRAHPLA